MWSARSPRFKASAPRSGSRAATCRRTRSPWPLGARASSSPLMRLTEAVRPEAAASRPRSTELSTARKVVWFEGLFLQPQHMQQQERYLERYANLRSASLVPHSWGFTHVELDPAFLSI